MTTMLKHQPKSIYIDVDTDLQLTPLLAALTRRVKVGMRISLRSGMVLQRSDARRSGIAWITVK